MGFSSDYLYYFHYSDSMGYLIFCCHSVATIIWIYMAYMACPFGAKLHLGHFQLYLKCVDKSTSFYVFHIWEVVLFVQCAHLAQQA